MKSSAKYYHVDLEVLKGHGKWHVRLNDPSKHTTVDKTKLDTTMDAAKNTASAVAHGYLTKEYPDQQWPVLPIDWKDSK